MLDVVAANLGLWIVGFYSVVCTFCLVLAIWNYRNCDGSCSKSTQ